MARVARQTRLSAIEGFAAGLVAQLRIRIGKERNAGDSELGARSASRTASSTERRSTPGMAATGTRVLDPSTRNSGQIRSSVVSTFSRTSRRVHSALRLRRGRLVRSSRALALFSTGAMRASIGRPYLIAMSTPVLLACGAQLEYIRRLAVAFLQVGYILRRCKAGRRAIWISSFPRSNAQSRTPRARSRVTR